MSRWDALRPEGSRRKDPLSTARSFNQRRRQRQASLTNSNTATSRPSSSWNASPPCPRWNRLKDRLVKSPEHVHADDIARVLREEEPHPASLGEALTLTFVRSGPRLDLALPILSTQRAELSTQQVQECEQILAKEELNQTCIEATCYFLWTFLAQISAEQAANTLVGDKLLSFLEQRDADHAAQRIVLDTIHTLLTDDRFARSILSPLTVDVTDGGEEETIPNPLKTRLFSILQDRLSESNLSKSSIGCLIAGLSHVSCSKGRQPLDLAVVENYLSDYLQDEIDCDSELDFLKALLRSHPESTISLAKLFLGDVARPAPTTEGGCSCRPRSVLMKLLHANPRDRVAGTVQQFLKSMPLTLWIGGKQVNSSLTRGRHFIGQRVGDALVEFVHIVQCGLSRGAGTTKSLCMLATSVLMDIPYSNDHDELTAASVALVAALGAYIVTRRDPMVSCAVDCLEESTGGHARPDGTTTAIALPTHIWLKGALGQKFQDYLLVSLETGLSEEAHRNSVRLLGAILRGAHGLVMNSEARADGIQRLMIDFTNSASSATRLAGVGLVEKALVGRKDMVKAAREKGESEFSSFAATVAQKSTEDSSAAVRTSALRCYGAFDGQDWRDFSDDIVDGDGTVCLRHVQTILSHCLPSAIGAVSTLGEKSANTRAAACKAIADICSAYLDEARSGLVLLDDVQVLHFSGRVAETLITALLDSSAAVRSMAVFALGNLALGLRYLIKRDVCFIPPSSLRSAFGSTLKCISEEHDKVANNAIRAAGHVGYLAFHKRYRDFIESEDWGISSAYADVQRALCHKVEMALSEANGSFKALSWKQRSVTKKHGWGACSSLALILDGDIAVTEDTVEISRSSLRSLVACLQLSRSINEKVSSTATAAIRKISVGILSRLSGNSGLIGSAIAMCLPFVFQAKGTGRHTSGRLRIETELLLQHLLQAASIYDMCCLLKSDETSTKYLGVLYRWMVDHEMKSNSFESLALALQRRDLSGDVALQQKFASRALLRYREDHTPWPGASAPSAIIAAHDQDTDEDEL